MRNKRKKTAGIGLGIMLSLAVIHAEAADVAGAKGDAVQSLTQTSGEVVVDQTNFPDAVFRQYVLDKVDKDQNGSLSADEINGCKRITVGAKGIGSLKGIEYFGALTYLSCYENQLSALDVSRNTALTELRCGSNQLSSLDVSQNTALTYLSCYENQLSTLDVSRNTALTDLRCASNRLKSLDLSRNTGLTYLSCFENQLGSLDLNQHTALKEFLCYDNAVSLDGSQLDMTQYDRNFNAGRVSNLVGVNLIGSILTLNDGESSGSYSYDCGQGRTMTVIVRKGGQGTGTGTGIGNGFPFIDVEQIPGNWKYQSIKYVYENGIMGGVGGSNQFQPDNQLTRAMFATVLYRMAGEPAVTYSSTFSDVEQNKWYTSAILWANTKGIVNGYSDGRYGVDDNITREQIAKMLCIFGETQGYDVSGKAALDSFTDASEVGSWAVGYMQWAVDAGMISGKPNTDASYRLDPKGQATRAECAKMLMMFQQKYQ